MKKLLVCMLAVATLAACQKGDKGDAGATGAPAPTPTVTPEEQDIASVIADENAYREAQGQTELSSGLSCSVQAVASGQWLSSSSPGYQAAQGVLVLTGSSYSFLLTSTFNQANQGGNNPFSILPTAIQPLFENINFRLSCSGQLVILDTDYYAFDVNSDDGSILTIDGTQVVNNDGNHGMTDKSGTKLLRRGVHTISLLYAQSGAGNDGLIVNVNGSAIDSKLFAH